MVRASDFFAKHYGKSMQVVSLTRHSYLSYASQ